ncbi:MAG: hypothetical protein D6731_18975, partial [Planctomycetota bacterium]
EESPLHPSIKEKVVSYNRKRPLTTTLTPVTDTLNMRFIHNKAYRRALASGQIVETFQDKEKVFALSEAFGREHAQPPLIYAGTGVYKLRAVEPCARIIEDILTEYRRLAELELPRF